MLSAYPFIQDLTIVIVSVFFWVDYLLKFAFIGLHLRVHQVVAIDKRRRAHAVSELPEACFVFHGLRR